MFCIQDVFDVILLKQSVLSSAEQMHVQQMVNIADALEHSKLNCKAILLRCFITSPKCNVITFGGSYGK